MVERSGPRRPPTGTQFRKGQSGNPKGRPKSKPLPPPSAFDVVIDRVLTVTQNGQTRELTVEEALQHRTLENAMAGDRAAQREVLRMMKARQKWFAAKAPKAPSLKVVFEPTDPDNANAALLLLGIAEPDNSWPNDDYERLLLQPWAVQAALSRPGGRRLAPTDISEIKRYTRDADTLRWPRGSDE